MSLVSIDWKPEKNRLRQFGFIAVFALPLLAAVWSRGNVAWTGGFAVAGLVAGLLGWLKPGWLTPLYLGLVLLFFPIGLLVGEILMGIFYFGVILPFALVFRLMQRDALNLRAGRGSASEWKPLEKTEDPARYFNQF